LGKNQEWDVMVDLFFYKKVDEAIKAEEEEEEGDHDKHVEEKGKKKWDTYGQEAPEGEGENWEWGMNKKWINICKNLFIM